MDKYTKRGIVVLVAIWALTIKALLWLSNLSERIFGPFDSNDPTASESPFSIFAIVIVAFAGWFTYQVAMAAYVRHRRRLRAKQARTRRHHPTAAVSPVSSR